MSIVNRSSIDVVPSAVPAVLLVGLICFALWTVTLFGPRYPHFLLPSLFIIGFQIVIVVRFGLFSAPSLVGSLLAYPALVPFFSEYVFTVPIYAVRGMRFQTPTVVNKAIFLACLAISSFVFVLFALDAVSSEPIDINYWVIYDDVPFSAIAVLVLVSAYLTTPGPTMLTADYYTIRLNYYSWADFAGSLFMGAWVIFYLQYRTKRDDNRVTRAFYGVTILGVMWLLLHNRQNESMGVLGLLAIDFFRNQISLRELLSSVRGGAVSIVLALLFAGQVFADTLLVHGLSGLSRVINPTGSAMSYPGGAQNIYGGFQATVHLFSDGEAFFWGQTFLNYGLQSIPTGIIVMLGLPYPPLYSDFLSAQYTSYLGGTYVLNTYYANFSMIGILLAGVILGTLAYFAHSRLVDSNRSTFLTGCAGVFVVAAFRSLWYTQLSWIDTFQGYLLAFGIYLLAVNGPAVYRRYAR